MAAIRDNFQAIHDQLRRTVMALPQPDAVEDLGFYYFLPKAYMIGRGIALLSDEGGATEARILLRSLADHLIEFRYILEDPEPRMTQFGLFTPIESMRRIRAYRKANIWGHPPSYFDDLEAQARPEYDEVVAAYRKENGSIHRSWHGKSTLQLAECVGSDLESLYELLFRDTSSSVHPSNLDSRHYVVQEASGQVRAILQPDDPKRTDPEWLLPLAGKILIDLAALADDHFDLGDEERIEELDRELMALLKKSAMSNGQSAV